MNVHNDVVPSSFIKNAVIRQCELKDYSTVKWETFC